MIHSAEKQKSSFLIYEVIRISAFRHLWFGQICSLISTNTLTFVLALHLYSITQSNTAVSILFLIYGLSAMLLGMVAGTVVDKLEKRRVLIICDISRALIIFTYIFAPQNTLSIYLLTFLNSVISQFYVPAEAPTIPYLVPKNLIISANSLFSITFYSSLAFGSILAGPMLRIFGPVYVFIFLSLLFILAAINVSQLPNFAHINKNIVSIFAYSVDYIFHRLIANIIEAISYVKSSATLSDAMILLMGTQVTLAILGVLGPGFADKVMGIDVRDSSLLIMGPAVFGILLGALTIGNISRKIKPQTLIKIGIISAGILLIFIAVIVRVSRITAYEWILSHQLGISISVILFFLLGVANSLLDVPANSILQQSTNDDMRGRVYGILSVGFGGIGMMPVVFSGLLADVIGVGKVILFLGIIITGYGILRMKYNKI
jgi:MFS family permease